MQWTAQFDLALDVDDAAGTGPDAAGDARRLAEHIATQSHDAQPIDLAYLSARCIDQRDVSKNHRFPEVANTGSARDLLTDRVLDVFLGRDLATGDTSPMTDLCQQVADEFDAKGQTMLIVGDTGGMFDDPRDGVPVEWFEIFLFRHPTDHARQHHFVVGGALELIVEVGQD